MDVHGATDIVRFSHAEESSLRVSNVRVLAMFSLMLQREDGKDSTLEGC
jgi:hypothetical protein